jgi:hypothetical protein
VDLTQVDPPPVPVLFVTVMWIPFVKQESTILTPVMPTTILIGGGGGGSTT